MYKKNCMSCLLYNLEQLQEQIFTIQKLLKEGEYTSSHEQELSEKIKVNIKQIFESVD